MSTSLGCLTPTDKPVFGRSDVTIMRMPAPARAANYTVQSVSGYSYCRWHECLIIDGSFQAEAQKAETRCR